MGSQNFRLGRQGPANRIARLNPGAARCGQQSAVSSWVLPGALSEHTGSRRGWRPTAPVLSERGVLKMRSSVHLHSHHKGPCPCRDPLCRTQVPRGPEQARAGWAAPPGIPHPPAGRRGSNPASPPSQGASRAGERGCLAGVWPHMGPTWAQREGLAPSCSAPRPWPTSHIKGRMRTVTARPRLSASLVMDGAVVRLPRPLGSDLWWGARGRPGLGLMMEKLSVLPLPLVPRELPGAGDGKGGCRQPPPPPGPGGLHEHLPPHSSQAGRVL